MVCYRVELSQDERGELQRMVGVETQAPRKLKRALILLLAGQGVSEEEITNISGASGSTVYRIKRKFVEGDLEAALNEQPRSGMTRPYAKELYDDELHDGACLVCGFLYVKELPEDLKKHCSRHARILSVFEPKPNKALAKLNTKFGCYVPVTPKSPTWMHLRLAWIATVLKRENGYDFIMWDASGDDGQGFILTDSDGRALGGCAVRRREWSNAPACWVLQWIWVAPPYRRQGLLRNTWLMLTAKYDGIIPEPPYSLGVARFLLSLGNLSELVESAARHAVN